MLYVTGDLHADWRDFESRPFGRLKKEDRVIICGDFGMIWDGSAEEKRQLAKIGKSRHDILFLDGAHENFELLKQYPVEEWNGGKVQVISGRLIRLMRGQVYNIDGKKVFTFGGGESDDRDMREPGVSWWPEEMPSMEEMREGIENLVQNDWQVDYILTYDAPSSVCRLMAQGAREINPFEVYLDHIAEKCRYVRWVMGDFHVNKRLSTSMNAVYDDVLRLGTETKA